MQSALPENRGVHQKMRFAIMLIAATFALGAGSAGPLLADTSGAGPHQAPEGTPSACATKAVHQIQSRYRETRDLRARFRQETRSVAFGTQGATQASGGRVQFAKPGKMRWSYETPTRSLVLSDGDVLWLFDSEKREAQRVDLAGGDAYFSAAGVRFLLGEGDILREFRVTRDDCSRELFDLELVPRQAATYEKLQVFIDPATGDLVQTRIVDLLGNETVVEFSEIEVNRDPDPATFEFEPPSGVRVIELGQP